MTGTPPTATHAIPKSLRYVGLCLTGIAMIAILYVYFSYDHDIEAAYARIGRLPAKVLRGEHGDIEYLVKGEGPTILICHGVTGGLDQGISLTTTFGLFDSTYRFLYVSRFGYLKSSLPDNASAELQAAVYRELLDHLGIQRVFVFGNSAGGTSAMWFAIDFPERTMGLILHSSAIPGPVLPPPPKMVFQSNFVYWGITRTFPDMLIKALLPDDIYRTMSPTEKEFIVKNAYVAALPITERSAGIMFDNSISTPSVNQIPFERIKAPTLILQGVDDPRENAGGLEMAKRIPNSRFVGMTGGHFLLRQEKKVRHEITDFILAH